MARTVNYPLPLTGQCGFVRAASGVTALGGVAMNQRYPSISMSQRPAASSAREDDGMHPGKGARH